MFEGRDTRYVAGCMLIITATTLSTAGIASPGWLHFLQPQTDNLTSKGLFMECRHSQPFCGALSLMDVNGYEMWSHVIISIGVISLIISCLFICVFNCGSGRTNRRIKVVEGFGIYGGFFIFIGIVNYVANDRNSFRSSYGYSFFLTVLASLLAVGGGVLVALRNRVTAHVAATPHLGEADGGPAEERGEERQRPVRGKGAETCTKV